MTQQHQPFVFVAGGVRAHATLQSLHGGVVWWCIVVVWCGGVLWLCGVV